MLSKNNNKELMRKQEPKKQRFAIKKLTVGVASVLIGFTFMGLSVSAHASDATQAQTTPATKVAGADNVQNGNTSASDQQQKMFQLRMMLIATTVKLNHSTLLKTAHQ